MTAFQAWKPGTGSYAIWGELMGETMNYPRGHIIRTFRALQIARAVETANKIIEKMMKG